MAGGVDLSGPKIILIGLNKTATLAFHELFVGSGIPSVHWRDDRERYLAHAVLTNHALDLPPFHGFDALAFTDISFASDRWVIEGARFFRRFHTAYPDAFFILNTRPVDAWLASRAAHASGTFLRRCAKAAGCSTQDVLDGWRRLHTLHEAEVTAHFAGHERFLRFDISRDDPRQIADFLAPTHAIDTAHWAFHNARNRKIA